MISIRLKDGTRVTIRYGKLESDNKTILELFSRVPEWFPEWASPSEPHPERKWAEYIAEKTGGTIDHDDGPPELPAGAIP